MGLLETEIKELRQLGRDYREGNVRPDQVLTQLAIYSQIEKRAKMMIQSFAIAARYKNNALGKIVQSNLIGNKECIDIDTENPDLAKVMCKMDDSVISRQECLDKAGDPSNHDICLKCDTGKTVKEIIL